MLRMTLISLLLGLVATSAQAHDDTSRTIVGAGLGAAVGAAIGSELGGRSEAVLGSAIGGALGAAIATEDRHDHYPRYRRAARYESSEILHYECREQERRYKRKRRGASSCPPGLAMQGRC